MWEMVNIEAGAKNYEKHNSNITEGSDGNVSDISREKIKVPQQYTSLQAC